MADEDKPILGLVRLHFTAIDRRHREVPERGETREARSSASGAEVVTVPRFAAST